MSGSSKFIPSPEMIADEVDPRPVNVWLWGVTKHYGSLTKYSREFLRLNLLPSAQASVTPEGIYFERMYYSCSPEWRARARESGGWRITVAYDPRLVDFIFIREGGKCLETCRLTDRYWKLLQGLDFREAREYFDRQKAYGQSNQSRKNQTKASLRTQQNQIFKKAQQENEESIKSQEKSSNTKLIGELKPHREIERTHERRLGVEEWYGETENNPEKDNFSDEIDQSNNEQYVAPAEDDEILNELLGEL